VSLLTGGQPHHSKLACDLYDLATIFQSVVHVVNELVFVQDARRLSINVMNVSGPRYNPCGMPAFITSQSVTNLDMLTPVM